MRRFLPIDTIIEDVIDWGGYRGMLDRVAMKKWANSLLKKLGSPNDYIDKIQLIEVKNYRADIPEDLNSIVQMSFRDATERKVRRTEIVEWTQKTYDGSGCELVITKDCPECHNEPDCECNESEIIYDVDRMWELAHPEFKYNHMKHYYRHGGLTNENKISSAYHPEFVLMKPSRHNFFNADLHIPGCLNLNEKLLSNCNTEYKVHGSIIEVNKKEGQILVSYLADRLDDNGYRMIPDVEDVFEALKWHIIEAMEYRAIGKSTTNADRAHHKQMFAMAEQRKLSAMGRAYEILNTPDFEDWKDFISQNYLKMIKDWNLTNYYGVKTRDEYGTNMASMTRHTMRGRRY